MRAVAHREAFEGSGSDGEPRETMNQAGAVTADGMHRLLVRAVTASSLFPSCKATQAKGASLRRQAGEAETRTGKEGDKRSPEKTCGGNEVGDRRLLPLCSSSSLSERRRD